MEEKFVLQLACNFLPMEGKFYVGDTWEGEVCAHSIPTQKFPSMEAQVLVL